jgi:hypothetical protein
MPKKNLDPIPATVPLPAPNRAEQSAIASASARVVARSPRFSIQIQRANDGKLLPLGPDHADVRGWVFRLEDTFGTSGTAFASAQLDHMIRACQDSAGKIDGNKLNSMLAVIDGIRPENELQAMIAVQMALTHSMALDTLRRAQSVDQIPQVDSAGSLAVKLLRTFTMQVEALTKLQRGGEQIVKVVRVHAGGQAIVGTVRTEPREGGGTSENRNQPHAKEQSPALGAPNCREMRCPDPIRDTMPIAESVGSHPMPHARRRNR